MKGRFHATLLIPVDKARRMTIAWLTREFYRRRRRVMA